MTFMRHNLTRGSSDKEPDLWKVQLQYNAKVHFLMVCVNIMRVIPVNRRISQLTQEWRLEIL